MSDQRSYESSVPNNSPANQYYRRQLMHQAGTPAQHTNYFDSNLSNYNQPAMDPNWRSSHQSQGYNRPEQYTYTSHSNALPHPSGGQQYFGPQTMFGSVHMRQFPTQTPPQPYDHIRDNAPAPHLPVAPANNAQYQPGYHYPNMSHGAIDVVDPTQEEDSDNAEDGQGSSRDYLTQHAGETTRTHETTSEPSTNENEDDGLLFNSYTEASATTDRLFRTQMKKVPKDDDFDVVERDKRVHVQSIVDALKQNDVFLPPPESKRTKQAGSVALSDTRKARWQKWQEDAKQTAEVHLSQPNSAELVELRAWDIIEEIIKIHRVGYRFTRHGIVQKLRCSARVAKALQVIKDYAIVRRKLLDDDDIPDFCNATQRYAQATVTSLWNNSFRKSNRNVDATASTGSRRIPVANGSVARKYQTRADVFAKKRQDAKKSAGKSAGSIKDTSIEQESQNGVASQGKVDAADGGKEREEHEDDGDDAELEEEADAEEQAADESTNQELNDVVATQVDNDTVDYNPYGFRPGDLRFGPQLPNDDSNSYAALAGNAQATMNSSQPSTPANRYGPGMSRSSRWEAYHRSVATPNNVMFPDNGSTGEVVPGVNRLQYGMRGVGNRVSETPVSPSARSNTVGQLMLVPDSYNSGSIFPETRANKKRKL